MGREGDVNLGGTIQKKQLMQEEAGCESCHEPLAYFFLNWKSLKLLFF